MFLIFEKKVLSIIQLFSLSVLAASFLSTHTWCSQSRTGTGEKKVIPISIIGEALRYNNKQKILRLAEERGDIVISKFPYTFETAFPQLYANQFTRLISPNATLLHAVVSKGDSAFLKLLIEKINSLDLKQLLSSKADIQVQIESIIAGTGTVSTSKENFYITSVTPKEFAQMYKNIMQKKETQFTKTQPIFSESLDKDIKAQKENQGITAQTYEEIITLLDEAEKKNK